MHRSTPLTPAGGPDARRPRSSAAAEFTKEEKRDIFRGMVVGELEAGFLRYSRRQALIRYAATLGISEFDANLLIAEAQFRADDIDAVSFDDLATLDNLSRPDSWSVGLRLTVALMVAIFVDLLAIHWFFG